MQCLARCADAIGACAFVSFALHGVHPLFAAGPMRGTMHRARARTGLFIQMRRRLRILSGDARMLERHHGPHREDGRRRDEGQLAAADEGIALHDAAVRGPHWQGLPCWQPHWQADSAGFGAWQPQVQAAPMQSVQEQTFVSRFMMGSFEVGRPDRPDAHSGNRPRRDLEQKG